MTTIGLHCENVRSVGLLPSRYGALAHHLRKTCDVVEFHYDWRKSIVGQAERLNRVLLQLLDQTRATEQSIHFVGHSMGGLVARMFMARHRATWRRLRERPDGSRLIMLGTPNGGSLSVVNSLIGQDSQVRMLARLDMRNRLVDILNAIGSFPGLLELLPAKYTKDGRAAWRGLERIAPEGWLAPSDSALRAAFRTQQHLTQAPDDSAHMFYIAGRAAMTPVSMEVRRHKGEVRARLLATAAGDGRVAWSDGRLQNVPTWYAGQTQHRDLSKDKRLFAAISELATQGDTRLLSRRAPVAADETALVEMPAASRLAAATNWSDQGWIKRATAISGTVFGRPTATGMKLA